MLLLPAGTLLAPGLPRVPGLSALRGSVAGPAGVWPWACLGELLPEEKWALQPVGGWLWARALRGGAGGAGTLRPWLWDPSLRPGSPSPPLWRLGQDFVFPGPQRHPAQAFRMGGTQHSVWETEMVSHAEAGRA